SNVAWSFVEVSQLFFGEKGKSNQVLPYELSGVYGYNSTDGNNSRATNRGMFWYVPGKNPKTGRQNTEITTLDRASTQAGKTYVMSFLLRTDGDMSSIELSFWSATNGHRRVTPTITNAQPIQSTPSIRRISTAPTVINPGGGGRRSGQIGRASCREREEISEGTVAGERHRAEARR